MAKIVVHLDGHTVVNDVSVVVHQNEISQTVEEVVVSDTGYTEVVKRMNESPSPPTGLGATQTETAVTVFWDAVPNVEKYNVYKNGTYVATTLITQWTDSDLEAGDLIDYTVYSVDEDLEPAFQFSTVSETLTVSFAGPAFAGDRMDVDAMIETLVINNGGTNFFYGMPSFPLQITWLNFDGSFAGVPPVEGLQMRDDSGNIIGSATFNPTLSSEAANHYTMTLPSFGPSTNLWITWGEHASTPDQIRGVYDTGFTLAALSAPSPPPASTAASRIQGYGAAGTYGRDLVNGSEVITIDNLSDANSVGTARYAFQATGNRPKYIIPRVKGYVDPGIVYGTRGSFAYMGETDHLFFTSPPEYFYTIFYNNDDNQLFRHLSAANGQWSRDTENARRIFSMRGKHITVDHCSLLHNIDGCVTAGNLSREHTYSNNLAGIGLIKGHNDFVYEDAGKPFLLFQDTADISVLYNMIYSIPYRTPQSQGRMTDVRNNFTHTCKRGAYIANSGGNAWNCRGNMINNVHVMEPSVYNANSAYIYLIDSGRSDYPAIAHASGNAIDIGNGLQSINANFRNNAQQVSEVTVGPDTGIQMPPTFTIPTDELELYLMANVGSHFWDRTDVDQDILNRISNRTHEEFDGVAGPIHGTTLPAFRSNGEARRLYSAPGRSSGWPLIPNRLSLNPAFDDSQVDKVPSSWKLEQGLSANQDTTKSSVRGDGIPDFERYIEEITGIAPY